MLENPLLFKLVHPTLHITLSCLGIDHELSYSQIPDWCKEIFEKSDILLHEGSGETVLIDPFSTRLAFRDPSNSRHVDWYSPLSSELKDTAQAVLVRYCKHVKDHNFPVPSVSLLRSWAITELLENLNYFFYGNEVDHVLHRKFLQKNKRVVSLDFEFSRNRILKQSNYDIRYSKYPDLFIEGAKKNLEEVRTVLKENVLSLERDEEDKVTFVL